MVEKTTYERIDMPPPSSVFSPTTLYFKEITTQVPACQAVAFINAFLHPRGQAVKYIHEAKSGHCSFLARTELVACLTNKQNMPRIKNPTPLSHLPGGFLCNPVD
jgi:hypothetical protein